MDPKAAKPPHNPVLEPQLRPHATPTPQPRAGGAGRGSNRGQGMQRRGNGANVPRGPANHGPSRGLRGQMAMQQGRPPQPVFKREGQDAGRLDIVVRNMPKPWTTWDIYQHFHPFGSIDRIDIHEPDRTDSIGAVVTFMPAPSVVPLLAPMTVRTSSGGQLILKVETRTSREFIHQSPKDPERQFRDQISIPIIQVQFGVMKAADTMLVLDPAPPARLIPQRIILNLTRQVLEVVFTVTLQESSGADRLKRALKMRLSLPQLQTICEQYDVKSERKCWVLSMNQPPMVFRKTENIEKTHEGSAGYWTEWLTWFRQTEIDADINAAGDAMIQLQNENAIVDIGRCLTYKLVFEGTTVNSDAFKNFRQALADHSVPVQIDKTIRFDSPAHEDLWSWLDSPMNMSKQSSTLSDIHQMAHDIIDLPFAVRYQLEVCISQGILHECNITKEFLEKLANNKDHALITKTLEKAVDAGERFFNPDEIFRRLSHKANRIKKSMPEYCTTIRSATVTPTTIYFMTPMMETSNRVVRKYEHYEDRFLRVKFTDEKYKGKVMSTHSVGDATMNQVYTRVKRALANGINVAGRRYEFLAFGNSQFREHGAWFFASIGDITADKIRKDLGSFDHIKNVAKYTSRIGQCFSTTKSTRVPPELEEIPDINKEVIIGENTHTYCFTDGVGKISPFVAQMIAQQLNYPSTVDKCPSTFQIRYEGCKGILVVDPTLTGRRIQIRPSMKKFSGTQHTGLEIVRVSQYSTSYLNVQLILVLSALGVEDDVFVEKMKRMIADLEEAMHNEDKALQLLGKNIDYNRMTLQLASAIADDFMKVKDPFIISCLNLWRSWTLKYLKEKARIFIDQGAFVFGCVDETATLRGHYGTDQRDDHDESKLPEIFLQVDNEDKGAWKVIKGVCLLMRNPSLHPGDIRVVRAVDVPALHHIRDCVALPSTGDRDLANMCSGGDLDGDDYLVVWDKELMPTEWNHPPMDYTGPVTKTVQNVTVDDMTSFFVTHMKYDMVAPIAVAHRYWADWEPEGVKSSKCTNLAELHSAAVDFVKTGVPAIMPAELKVKRWPHWSEAKVKSKYTSKRVIGQLYDTVQRAPFTAAWALPFDKRVLEAYDLDAAMLQSAREAKELYDEGVRQVMAKYAIGNEFEVWTTFVMEHSDDVGDYKFAEKIGEAAGSLKEAHRRICCEKAGTDEVERDWEKLGPFVAAMYAVTNEEVRAAVKECERKQMKGGEWVPVKVAKFDNMPFISFPWLFQAELGRIAKGGKKNVKPPLSMKPSGRPVNVKVFEEEDLLLDEGDVIDADDAGRVRQQQKLFLPTSTSSSQDDLLTDDASHRQEGPMLSSTPSLNPPTQGSGSPCSDSDSDPKRDTSDPAPSSVAKDIAGEWNEASHDSSHSDSPA